jgi:hypothetical protein
MCLADGDMGFLKVKEAMDIGFREHTTPLLDLFLAYEGTSSCNKVMIVEGKSTHAIALAMASAVEDRHAARLPTNLLCHGHPHTMHEALITEVKTAHVNELEAVPSVEDKSTRRLTV